MILHGLLVSRSFSTSQDSNYFSWSWDSGLETQQFARLSLFLPLQGTCQPASLQGFLRILRNLLFTWSRRGVVYSLLCQAPVNPLAFKIPCEFSIFFLVWLSLFLVASINYQKLHVESYRTTHSWISIVRSIL